jgi:hypothetical protein
MLWFYGRSLVIAMHSRQPRVCLESPSLRRTELVLMEYRTQATGNRHKFARRVVHLLSFETNGEWNGRSVWAIEVLEQTASDSVSRIGLRAGGCGIYNDSTISAYLLSDEQS